MKRSGLLRNVQYLGNPRVTFRDNGRQSENAVARVRRIYVYFFPEQSPSIKTFRPHVAPEDKSLLAWTRRGP